MPIELYVKNQELGTFLRLRCVVNYSSKISKANEKTLQVRSENFHINDLATVRLEFENSKSAFTCKILAVNHESAKNCKVKVNVSCQDVDTPFYSEWICDDQWKVFGKKSTSDTDFLNVVTDVLDINITACKVIESFIVKLYNDVYFTDFKLSTVEGSVPVHRACLAVCSDVFQAMLTREWKETSEGRIEIEGVSLRTLQHLKDYMYLNTLPEDGLEQLLKLASYYLIDSLKAECVSKLALTSKPQDWGRLLELSVIYKIPELMCAVQMMVNPALALDGKIIGYLNVSK
ncbi:protein roadkill-like [Cydia strobilella]|uniref:protein roadkill-like n=1 Tax=Cydia strobilella TaxID=1100964 RepID=UPI0030053802